MHPTTIAVDLAKSVFQISIANQADRVVERKRLTRSQFKRFIVQQAPTVLVMEACATANYWSQFAQAQGHTTKLLHPYYVKPYVRRNKTDAADADALLRAHKDPHLLPVPTKYPDQQALQGLHRIRQQLIRTRTGRINLARALLAEFGIPLASGTAAIGKRLMAHIEALPLVLHTQFNDLVTEIQALGLRIEQMDKSLANIAKNDATAQLLMSIPGIGVTTATALIAGVPDIHLFKRARQFSAWLGVTPKEHSSGNKRRLGAISKQGDTYLRTLMVHCARSALQQAHRQYAKDPDGVSNLQHWVLQLEGNRPRNVATVALANKMARLVWVTWTQSRDYKP
jgi:transposase